MVVERVRLPEAGVVIEGEFEPLASNVSLLGSAVSPELASASISANDRDLLWDSAYGRPHCIAAEYGHTPAHRGTGGAAT